MIQLLPEISALVPEMTKWRHHLHAHPETAFEEVSTAQFITDRLREFGLNPVTGLGKTGVVASLKRGTSNRSIGLRADIDALDIPEANGFAHTSTIPGKMHGCGHDGHTTMLLGAAKYLTEHGDFDGTIHFVFQPAEENEGGGKAMLDDGLLTQFPMEAVYGMHNWPTLPLGNAALRKGPLMGAFDLFEITLSGKGAHAAMPHQGKDTLLAAGHLITALQSIASRSIHPLEAVVVSVTQMHGGDTWNVLPETAVLRGTVRTFTKDVQDTTEARMTQIADGIAATFGIKASVSYDRRYPATVNDPEHAEFCAQILQNILGMDAVDTDTQPTMGAEDFAFLLQEVPGCYVWLGTGVGDATPGLHNPSYDFNDAALPIGATYWSQLAMAALPK